MAPQPPDPLYTIRGNMSSVHHVLYRKNGDFEELYAATSEGFVHVWELSSFREINNIKVGSESCLCVSYTGEHFVTQEKSGVVKWWIEENKQWKLISSISTDYFGFCKFPVFKNFVISPKNNSNIEIHFLNSDKKEIINSRENRVGHIMCLRYLKSLNCVLVAYESGSLTLWNIETSEFVCENMFVSGSDCLMALDFYEPTQEGVLGSSNDKVLKFSISNNTITKQAETTITNPGVSCITIHPNGKLCVAGCWDGRIRYFSMKKMTLLAVLDHHSGSIECVVFSDQELNCSGCVTLSAGGKDGKVSLWTLYST